MVLAQETAVAQRRDGVGASAPTWLLAEASVPFLVDVSLGCLSILTKRQIVFPKARGPKKETQTASVP